MLGISGMLEMSHQNDLLDILCNLHNMDEDGNDQKKGRGILFSLATYVHDVPLKFVS